MPAEPAARAAAADQRRQRHHAGDVDAAHALRRGPRRRGRLPPLRARSPQLALYETELQIARRLHRNVRVARGFTQTSGGAAPGRFDRRHLRSVISDHRDAADVRLRSAGADRRRARRPGRRRTAEPPTVETFAPPALALEPTRAEGRVRFARSGREAENSRPAAARAGRGRRPLRRSTAAAWASATPAPAARRAGAVRDVAHRRDLRPRRTSDSRSASRSRSATSTPLNS